MRGIFEWLASHSERRPWLVIFIILLITLALGAGASRIRQEFGYKAMLPKEKESVKVMEEAGELFGGTMEEQVLLEGEGVLAGSTLRKVAKLGEALRAREDLWDVFIRDVRTPLDNMVYIPGGDVASAMKNGGNGEYLLDRLDGLSDDELAEQVNLNIELNALRSSLTGFSRQLNISEDKRAMLIVLYLNPDLDTKDQIRLADPYSEFIHDYFGSERGVDLFLSGGATMSRDSNRRSMKDTRTLFLLAFLFILLVLYLTFRKVSDVVLTLSAILLTVIWVVGLQGWLGFPFTYQSSGIMPLLLGIDIAYAIHVLTRYYEERRGGKDAASSATRSVVTVGVAVFLTAATTAFGFASFGISDMPPVRQFGMLCVAGVMFSFFLSITLLPAFLVIRDRKRGSEGERRRLDEGSGKAGRQGVLERILVGVAMLSERHRAMVGLLTLIVIVGCFVLGTQLSTEADLTKMMPQDMPSISGQRKIAEYFGGQSIAYTLVSGDVLKPEALRAMLEYEKELLSVEARNEHGELFFEKGKVMSVASLLEMVLGRVPDSREEALMALQAMRSGSRSNSGGKLVSDDGKTAMISIRVSRGTDKEMKEVTRIIRDLNREFSSRYPDFTFRSSGLPLLLTDVLGSILPTQLKTSSLALGLCALLVIIVFGSVYFGLAAASVVFISIALEVAALVIIGWPLDFMTVMVSSLVIGAGIDFGIHVTHRFREEWEEHGFPVEVAMRRTVSNVGRALVSAALTTAGAFAIIGTSGISFMRRFGLITALSLVFALVSSLLVLPSILAWRAVRVEDRSGAPDR
ncbi:MAG: MMPL family transporter [Candidatus Geothermincolales bacterium]